MTAPLADRIRAVLALADASTPNLACRQLVSLRYEGDVFSVYGVKTGRIVAEVSGPKAAQDAELFANTGAMAALLRECLADDGWRPISEAPRDGTLVDLWCISLDDDGDKTGEATRITDVSFCTFVDDGTGRGDEESLGWMVIEGDESQWVDGPTMNGGLGWWPTHFRPLPAAPGAESPDARPVPDGEKS